MDSISIRRPDDWHVHLRVGEMLENILPDMANILGRVLVMPNTDPLSPIRTVTDVVRYRQEIEDALWKRNIESPYFKPLMTIQITRDTTPRVINEALRAGAVAGKLYPRGVTTNSELGLTLDDMHTLAPVWSEMATAGMVLCIHGEHPDRKVPGMAKANAFLPVLSEFLLRFPRLRVTLEHLSTKEQVEFVKFGPETIAGGLTIHHVRTTHDDLLGYNGSVPALRPLLYCKPVQQNEEDRLELLEAMVGGNHKFIFGSDSAPHLPEKKMCSECSGGVYMPGRVLVATLVAIFEQKQALHKLDQFLSHGDAHYRLGTPKAPRITLVKRPWVVEAKMGGVIPFSAGETLDWDIAT